MKPEELIKRYSMMASQRANWDQHWQDVTDYVMPTMNDVYGYRSPGEKKMAKVFDSTAIHANELLASALHGMLTNPSVQWFELSSGDEKLDKISNVRLWLQDAVTRIHNMLNNSNFQTEIHEVYLAQGSIGTSLMRIEEDDEFICRFHARPIFESYIAENNKGIIDTVMRCYKWSARQITQEFGEEALPASLKKEKYGSREFEIIHSVMPREDDVPPELKVTPKGMPFASYYLLKEEKRFISESGFPEFPYVVPRWTKASGEIYGRSPGMKALADIKMVNEAMKTTIRGAQKAVDPPLWLPDDGLVMPIRATPGALNYFRAGTQDQIRPLQTDYRVDIGYQVLNDVRQRIREAFFIDQLQLQEGPQMTATEVMQRTEEKLRLMGPILGRQQFELLRPMIDRVFNIMLRRKQFQPVPDELKNVLLQVRYSSMIAKAQRTSEAQNITRVIETIAPLVNANPQTMDVFDTDKTARYVSGIYGLPEEILRNEKDMKNIRDQRQADIDEAKRQQAGINQAEQISKIGSVAIKASQSGAA